MPATFAPGYIATPRDRYKSKDQTITLFFDAIKLFFENTKRESIWFAKAMKWLAKLVAVASTVIALPFTVPLIGDDFAFAFVPGANLLALSNDVFVFAGIYALIRILWLFLSHNIPIWRARKKVRKLQEKMQRRNERAARKLQRAH